MPIGGRPQRFGGAGSAARITSPSHAGTELPSTPQRSMTPDRGTRAPKAKITGGSTCGEPAAEQTTPTRIPDSLDGKVTYWCFDRLGQARRSAGQRCVAVQALRGLQRRLAQALEAALGEHVVVREDRFAQHPARGRFGRGHLGYRLDLASCEGGVAERLARCALVQARCSMWLRRRG